MNSLLTVTTYATSYDLTVLETVKLELGIGVGDHSQDDKLEGWIHQASAAIANRCKRVFAEETLSEVFRPEYIDREIRALSLKRRPVTSVISVVEDEITLASTEYEINYPAGLIYRMWSTDGLNRCRWSYLNKVVVSYTAGYLLLNDLPYDIERACILLIKYFNTWDVGGARGGDMNLRVVEIPGVIRREWGVNSSSSFTNSGSSQVTLPPDVMALISPYIESPIR